MISPTTFECVTVQINTKLCDQYSVTYYPMLLWGPPSKFVSGGAEAKQKGEIVAIDDGRTADRLLNWINKHMSRYFYLNWIKVSLFLGL